MSTPGRVVSTGMIYGVAVWLFMDFVVLTLSRARMTPVSSWPFWVNMVQQGLMVGLPIAWIVGRQQALRGD